MYDEYNTIANHEWIPKQAFLYFPSGDSRIRQEDDYKLIIKNQVKRLIYEGNIEYTDEENLKIQHFCQYLVSKHFVPGKCWSKAYLYKFLQSTNYDEKKAMRQIIAHNEYKAILHSKDFQQLRKTAQPFLKKGPVYLNGRDAKYRQILVCDIAKINQMKLTEEELFTCLQYFFEFLYRNTFINGQVENVVGIIDIGGISPFDLIKPMKMTISFLQGNYKYKLHAVYIIQSTGMFQMAYGMVKHLMKEDTIRKVTVIEKGQVIEPLLKYTNPIQLEQKFGGSHPNLEQNQFWPPQFFGDDYSHPLVERKMVTEEQYKQMYQEGLLPARKIYLDFVKESSSKESSASNQPPVLNNSVPSENFIPEISGIHSVKKEKSMFSKAMGKLGCHGCFGEKLHREGKKSKKKHKH